MRLRVGGLSGEELQERIEKILKEVGLEEIADRQVRVLSGVRPATSMVEVRALIDPKMLVEIEAEAILGTGE